ncbi:hypothetical protein CK203_006186 [Vitis vinifera]|uniref:Uncharacterized protein n=1 Tax=Vitis vinifera TaxID=29760 RepID=A0A438K636_VITVI|nr:hypothetical protein CK203_006186 [Vitis vinifera]
MWRGIMPIRRYICYLCKDDLVGFEFPDRDGDQNYESEPDCTEDDCINEDMQDAGGNHGRSSAPGCCADNRIHVLNHDKEVWTPDTVSYFSENVPSAPGCCADNRIHVLNHDKEICMPDTSEISKEQKVTKASEVLANKKSFLNGFLGNIFMARSYNLSKDVEWIKFACPQCSSLLGAYPCADGYAPLDGGVRLFKCYISTCLPVCESGDLFSNAKGKDLESLGWEMAKSWGLKGKMGVASLGKGRALLELEFVEEARRVLISGEVRKEVWVRILGLPISLWVPSVLRRVGDVCGGFLDIDPQIESMEELQWARILVKSDGENLLGSLEIGVEEATYILTLWWEAVPSLRQEEGRKRGLWSRPSGEIRGDAVARAGSRVEEMACAGFKE